MRELAAMPSTANGLTREDCLNYSRTARSNVVTAIKYWNLSIDGTYENVRALVMAVSENALERDSVSNFPSFTSLLRSVTCCWHGMSLRWVPGSAEMPDSIERTATTHP